MKVVLARKAGFCMGVRRAMQLALRAARRGPRPVFTYGPLIHNPQALDLLASLEVKILREIPREGEGTVIIRAHGVPPEEKRGLLAAGFNVIDGTCPRVIKVQQIAQRYAREGRKVIIIGDKDHAEVIGILGHCAGVGLVVSDLKDIQALSGLKDYVIVSQTTQEEETFEFLSQEILERFPGGQVFNTICNATHARQAEVKRLAQEAEAIVVVGGKASANTNRLAMVAREAGRRAYLVETEEDIPREELRQYSRVGVTAGASTPNWMINRIVRLLEEIPGRGESRLIRSFRKGLRLAVETNLAVAFSAAALAVFGLFCLGEVWSPVAPFVAGGYAWIMHTLNRLLDLESLRLNDPLRATFFDRHRGLFLVAALLLGLTILALAFRAGPLPGGVLFFLIVLGLIYSLEIIPQALRRLLSYRALKELPGTKMVFVAGAWGAVALLIPALSSKTSIPKLGGVFLLASLLAYLRGVFLEILEVQGDGFVGKETLPVFLGEERTLEIIKWTSGGLMALGLFLPAQALLAPAALAAFVGGIYFLYLARVFVQRNPGQGFRLEILVEGALPLVAIVSGILTLIF
ncbi:4-hydroxy-3-methylbut-2-enyl diphosphate reductase [Thermosulfuriphilus sp.]